MSSNSLASNLTILAFALSLLTSCQPKSDNAPSRCAISVSNPAMAFFVSRLVTDTIQVNTLIPQGADHDSYSPLPSQLQSLSNSTAYIAFGPLEFETTWHKRLADAAPNMMWFNVNDGIAQIDDDPHFWLSPRQARIMSRNVANAVKQSFPSFTSFTDSALVALMSDIDAADTLLTRASAANPGQSFIIYHPALAYLARDYGFRQFSVASEGVSPQPRHYAAVADSAKKANTRVFFIQPGMTPDRVKSTAAEVGASLVIISPEAYDWPQTMKTIADALTTP